MTLPESITLVASLANTGILTAIWYKLGTHDEKFKSHDERLKLLEKNKQGVFYDKAI